MFIAKDFFDIRAYIFSSIRLSFCLLQKLLVMNFCLQLISFMPVTSMYTSSYVVYLEQLTLGRDKLKGVRKRERREKKNRRKREIEGEKGFVFSHLLTEN